MVAVKITEYPNLVKINDSTLYIYGVIKLHLYISKLSYFSFSDHLCKLHPIGIICASNPEMLVHAK